MASIRKKTGSKYWFAAYSREDGVRVQTSTKSTDRKVAQRIAEELEEAHRRKITEAQMRLVLSNLNERLVGQSLASATLKDFAATWLAGKERELERVSYLAYKGAINDFVASTPNKANMGLQYVTAADVAAFRDSTTKKASAKTGNNKLKILRTMFQTAWRDGYITENPAAKVTVLPTEESIRRPFTLPELKRVYDVANGEWKGMLLGGLYLGQRLRDIATLRWSHVDMAKREIALTTSKTSRRQIIPIAAPLLAYLDALPSSDDPKAFLFPVAAHLAIHDGDVGRLSQQFYEILVTAGLAKERTVEEKANGKGVGRKGKRLRNELTFHCLRHTATSLLKNAGASETVARDIVGHDSAEVSRHYTHVDEASKRLAIDLLPDFTTKG